MPNETLITRLLEAATPFALAEVFVDLTRTFMAEGVSELEIYAAFCRLDEVWHKQQFSAGAKNKDELQLRRERILSVMDRMTGWCISDERIFESPVPAQINYTLSTFVVPFYLHVLHGNHACRLAAELADSEARDYVRKARRAVSTITPAVIDILLADRNWRARLTGAWYCGVKRWRQYSDKLGQLLVPSLQCYAGQGYCFALACFSDEPSAWHLCRYLDEYLPQRDKLYDQHWAMSALVWIDRALGTDYSRKYLEPGGLWDKFQRDAQFAARTLEECQLRFDRLMMAASSCFGDGNLPAVG